MSNSEPVTDLDARYSGAGATPTPWEAARDVLRTAELYWLATVRGDGRPHVTPLIGVWLDEAMYFCTGPQEEKAKNIAGNPHCTLTTGANKLHTGLDIVVEGDAVQVRDAQRLHRLAEAWVAKYGPEWHFDVGEHTFLHAGTADPVAVYEVTPRKVLGFDKDEPGSQTRWRF